MTPIKRVVIVCGDRNWTARRPIFHFLEGIGGVAREIVVITGGAAGVDTIAWEMAKQIGLRNVRLDAPWSVYGNRAGPIRNGWMLDLLLMFQAAYPDAKCDVHAFHANIASSKGTADMLERARGNQVQWVLHSDVEEGL